MSSSIRIKHINRYIDRHGRERIYYREPGKKQVLLRGPLGSAEFLKDYVKAANKPKPNAVPRPRKFSSTLAWLIGRYKTSAHWKAEISADTRKTRGNIFNKFIDTYGHMPITIETKHFYKIQDTLSATSHAANNLFKALRPVFKYAVKNDILKTNPMLG